MKRTRFIRQQSFPSLTYMALPDYSVSPQRGKTIHQKSYTATYQITSQQEMSNLFNYINRHLTLMESAFLKYSQDSFDSAKIQLPKQIHKTPEQYLAKFLEPSRSVTTKLIGSPCSICLQCYLPQEKYRQLSCHHIFHQNCIDSWLSLNLDDLSCPLCRKSQYKDNLL